MIDCMSDNLSKIKISQWIWFIMSKIIHDGKHARWCASMMTLFPCVSVRKSIKLSPSRIEKKIEHWLYTARARPYPIHFMSLSLFLNHVVSNGQFLQYSVYRQLHSHKLISIFSLKSNLNFCGIYSKVNIKNMQNK